MMFENEMTDTKRAAMTAAQTSCRCREPKTHRDCHYCGYAYVGDLICGYCKGKGIPERLIRETGRLTFSAHKAKM